MCQQGGRLVRRRWWRLVCLFVLCGILYQDVDAQGAPSNPRSIETVSIGTSALSVEETTVTVTVLEDALGPVNSLLELCESVGEEEGSDHEEFAKNVRELCRTIGQLTRGIEEPSHRLGFGNFVVTVPLKEPQGVMKAVRWKSNTLDEAITFVELLQGKKLKALTVYARHPWSGEHEPPCTECLIRDLVFDAGILKAQRDLLKRESR